MDQPKIIINKKKGMVIAAIILSMVFFSYGLFWLRRASAPQVFGEAILSVSTNEKIAALTFDDGPNPESTYKILELLQKYNSRGTFFVIGKNADQYPEIIKEIYLNGNELGNHSFSHRRLTFKSPHYINEEIGNTDKIIMNTGYEGIIYFRAPFGHKLFILPYILMKNNRKHILWNIELGDWENPAPEEMMKKIEKTIKPGSIILLHDGYTGTYQTRNETVKVVELLLEKYTKLGYRFVTISELLQ
jgi:peptidoglycan/xylan/chitin deacetylase (PgdA/CDA1 family)